MTDKLVDDLKRALGDAYTIERELTGGGMSRVFVAKEHALGREVVIKVLPPELAAGVNRDRFRREVQLAARLSHPYIVPLLHAGEDGELLWFTMPYIAGESLRTQLLRGPIALPEAVRLLHDLVEALAYAHSRGVVHRDIKPGNILTVGQHALVTDFGVAKALNAAMPNLGPGHTTSGMAIGTPAYMAPEQLAADPDADQRVDIYAVGLLAYEMLTGASPFSAPSPTATMTAQLTRVPPPLNQLRPDIPPAFSALVQHCLAKNPDDRPQNAEAVLMELDHIAGALAADKHRSASGESGLHPRASAVPLVLGGIATLVLVVGGFWWNQRNTTTATRRADSAVMHSGSDTGDLSVPLPALLTRQDSLNIANALRDQLQQIDAHGPTRQVVKRKDTDTLPLALQVKQLDSLTRVLLREQNLQRAATAVGVAAPAAPVPGSGLPQIAATAGSSRRLVIALPPRREPDSMLQSLQDRAGADLARRATGMMGWNDVRVDSAPVHGRPPSNPFDNADVLVFLALQRQEHSDSVVLRITVRNTAPGTQYGWRLLSSAPVYQPTSLDPFRSTLRDATRLLEQLRRLPPGQPWPQDMGRGFTMSGPSDGDMRNMHFTPQQFDSLRHRMDSMHGRHGRDADSQRDDATRGPPAD
jgi:serine/threonine protein kinase